MTWMPGSIEFKKPSEKQLYFEGNIMIKKIDALVINGIVLDSDGKTPIPEALVKLFARIKDGKEVSLGHSFSGSDGHYLLHIRKKKIPKETAALIVRATAG